MILLGLVMLPRIITAQVTAIPVDTTKDTVRYDPWMGFDKVQHFTVSCLWTLSSQYLLESKLQFSASEALPLSMGSAFLAGIGKEIYDREKKNGFFSRRDLVANVLGITVGILLIQL